MKEAVDPAEASCVTVCDCRSAWKKRAEAEDTTLLPANRINHPVREMHELLADMLFSVLFSELYLTFWNPGNWMGSQREPIRDPDQPGVVSLDVVHLRDL